MTTDKTNHADSASVSTDMLGGLRYCSFCGHSEKDCEFLVQTDVDLFICESCVDICKKSIDDERRKMVSAMQARIDALMLEHCPDEMTEDQKAEWAKHQKPISAEEQALIDAAFPPKALTPNATLCGPRGAGNESAAG